MSRIGIKPINIPANVEVNINNNYAVVKGPKGTLEQQLPKSMIIEIEGNEITVSRPSEVKEHKSLHGLTRTLINNMIVGVTEGYQKVLEIVGVGYRAQKQGSKLVMNLGFSHPVEMEDPKGIETAVEGANKILVKGIDKQQVGNYAAVIRDWRRPEPYKGKGIKYSDEVVRRKAGKTGK
nr:50S ribosomal protein L6 [Sedimentibacter sp.]